MSLIHLKKLHKNIAIFLLAIFIPSLFPVNLLYASNNGPTAPEATGFEPVNATDMVNLSSGDMSYVLPVMDVGGFPVTMSYHGGVPLDLESTWTGLGWNLNTGAINRSLNATPDDWNGGNSLDFIKYVNSEVEYTVNVGIGVAETAEIGVGMSWGSNKSMTGSVFANVGFGDYLGASASIDTQGNYSLGVSASTGKGSDTGFGGGLSISGNVNGGKIHAGVGVGVQAKGLQLGMGTSLTGNGTSVSMGYGQGSNYQNTTAGGGSISMSSFSQGDWDITSKGWYIPIQLPMFSFGFGKRKHTSTLHKSYNKIGFGALYMNNANSSTDAIESEANAGDVVYNDYQNRYRYMDAFDQTLPVSEKEFVGDYDLEREKLNFTYAGYDGYDVNATGVSGMMNPKILHNGTIFGLGYRGANPQSTSTPKGKLRIYNHNSNTNQKSFGKGLVTDIRFYFDGQFTEDRAIVPLTPVTNTSQTSNNLAGNVTTRPSANNARLQQGNYVEVYTNEQIRTGMASGLLSPPNLSNTARTNDKFIKDGIGGYKITAPDGKIYHFSLPVYQYEQVERSVYKDTTQNHVSDKRQYTPYATHWLLTAITGPDYFDVNNNNMADADDHGYWIRLDHGKWSEGYVWRSPTDKNIREYTSNIEGKIGNSDFGYYQFGRKQLYYLDRVVSSTHTAYFVKDLRYDSVGSDLTYKYLMSPNGVDNEGVGGGYSYPNENFTYTRQLQLMLKKIVLVKNQDAAQFDQQINTVNGLQLNTDGLSGYVDNYNLPFNCCGGFKQTYVPSGTCSLPCSNLNPGTVNLNIKLNQEQNVIDIKDFQSFDYSKAVKVVDLTYNYNLAVKNHDYTTTNGKSNGSPGVIKNTARNPNHGKLTLKSVRFLGRNNFDYMPPYQFEYDGEFKGASLPYTPYPPQSVIPRTQIFVPPALTYVENRREKDEWGFLKSRPQAWSMTRIITPTGAEIEFENEEDDFATEAFTRRYWSENLQFTFSNLTSTTFDITIKKNTEENLIDDIDFTEYFSLGSSFYFDLWLCVVDRDAFDSTDREKINIDKQSVTPLVLTNDQIVLRLSRQAYVEEMDDTGDVFPHTFRLTSGNGSEHPPQIGARGSCPGSGDGFNLVYRLLASEYPREDTGGGLRVKSITLKDENNNRYKTGYYYNKPGTNKNKNVGDYISSGITSYSPVKGTKFVPYQSQLPTPGVMYEYVTMAAENYAGTSLGKTRYRFHVLRPVFDIFDPNIKMFDDDGTIIFEAIVTNYTTGGSVYLDPATNKKIKAASIKINVNTSLVGQFRSVEVFNEHEQLMSKSEKKYLSGVALKNTPINRGTVQESFQSMKSIFTTNSDDNNPVLKERLLSVATKEEFASVLEKIVTTDIYGISEEIYSNTDPMTGVFNTVQKTKADGSSTRVEKIPAYVKYPQMGSKVASSSNKNMLTQEAMTITSITGGYGPKTLDASITTWNKSWTYRDNTGAETSPANEAQKVWRKHKSFIWKDDVHAVDGNYATTLSSTNSHFDWNAGAPLSSKWQKTSEITRYTTNSMPIETKDILGNFASSKMGDRNNKVLVSGNARYTEMYYSGAEYVDSNASNWFEGEVQGSNYRTADVAHTGSYSVKAIKDTDQVFFISGASGNTDYYTSSNYTAKFRPGKYKASVWALNAGNPASGTVLSVNGAPVTLSEVVEAGCWTQLNFYFDIPANAPLNTIALTCKGLNGSNYYDDFRVHPVSSTVNSYVYDHKTDELIAILDGNNMGSAYVYDNAGRVVATYVENTDAANLEGGFRLVGQNRQNYKSGSSASTTVLPVLNNCLATLYTPLEVTVESECNGTFENIFRTNVTGGSGNYSYEYKWLTDDTSDTFTSYSIGLSRAEIPYSAVECADGKFGKRWSMMVKVTDLITNKTTEQAYDYTVGKCEFYNDEKNWADVSISKCSTGCAGDNYKFIIYPKVAEASSNYKYEYATYEPYDPNLQNSFNQQVLNYIDISGTKGEFCPELSMSSDVSCTDGYRKAVYFTYRITNLETGKISVAEPHVFYADCVRGAESYPIVNDTDNKYMAEGNLLVRGNTGGMVRITNVNQVIK